ncbi:hypothetical protein ACFSRY_19760 [Pontibacter locisalis]|uniref:Uncharacterized protein n=1 Tax=Pontibacter locisalis TaxID=1719035 RepID=A0ABW5ISW9_9BACT
MDAKLESSGDSEGGTTNLRKVERKKQLPRTRGRTCAGGRNYIAFAKKPDWQKKPENGVVRTKIHL